MAKPITLHFPYEKMRKIISILISALPVFLINTSTFAQSAVASPIVIRVTFKNAPAYANSVKCALKYNKNASFSMTFDDRVGKAADAFAIWTGGSASNNIIYPGKYFTDGCNNKINYKASIACNAHSSNAPNVDWGTTFKDAISLKQLKNFITKGWLPENHGLYHNMNDIGWPGFKLNVTLMHKYIYDSLGFISRSYVNANADNGYLKYVDSAHYLTAESQSARDNWTAYPASDWMHYTTLESLPDSFTQYTRNYNYDWTPANVTSYLNPIVDAFTSGNNSTTHKMTKLFTHCETWNAEGFKQFSDYLELKAKDLVWVAPQQELDEYRETKRLTVKTESLTGNILTINLDQSKIPDTAYYHDISLLVNSSDTIQSVDVLNADSASVNMQTGLVNVYRIVKGVSGEKIPQVAAPVPPPVPYLKTDKTLLTEASVSFKDSIAISANTSWKITGPHAPFSLSATSGTGDSKVYISAPANNSFTVITDTLYISSNGVTTDSIYLSQAAARPSLSADSSSLILGADLNSKDSFNIAANVGWTISIDSAAATWLTITPATGSNNQKIMVYATQANGNTSVNSATITIISGDSTIPSKKITLVQSVLPPPPPPPYLLADKTVITENADSYKDSISISSNTSWKITNAVSFVSLSATSGTGDAKVYINGPGNKSLSAFTDTLFISANGIIDSIYLTQSGALPALSVDSISLTPGATVNCKDSFDIAANVNWTISISPDSAAWFSVTPVNGSGDHKIMLNVLQANNTTSVKTATIIITPMDSTLPVKTISLRQAVLPPAPVSFATDTIQAEKYVAMNNIKTENTNDVGAGLDVGYIYAGSWMDYNVPDTGWCTMKLRIASAGAGSQLQIRNQNGIILSTVNVPLTGGWQNWQTINTNVKLDSNTKRLRIFAVTSGWNINWISFTRGITLPLINYHSIPDTIQAEKFDNSYSVQNETTSDIGGGLNVGYINSGSWMDYNVHADAGNYDVYFRTASTNTTGQLQLRKADGTVLTTINVPNTGGWQTWKTDTSQVKIDSGNQVLRVYALSGGWNINWIIFKKHTTLSSIGAGNQNVPVNPDFYIRASLDKIYINMVHQGNFLVRVTDLSGRIVKKVQLNNPCGVTIYDFNLRGLFIVTVSDDKKFYMRKKVMME